MSTNKTLEATDELVPMLALEYAFAVKTLVLLATREPAGAPSALHATTTKA